MPRSFVELSPQNFSFNSPLGWCPACEGLGVERGTNQESLIPNPNLTLREGAIGVWPQPSRNPLFLRMLVAIGEQHDISIDTPWYQLDPLKQRVVLYGSEQWIECEWTLDTPTIPDAQSIRDGSAHSGQESGVKETRGKGRVSREKKRTSSASTTIRFQYKGLYPAFDEASRISYEYRLMLYGMMGEKPCSVCGGDRMREDAAAVRLRGLSLPQLARLPLTEVLNYLKSLALDAEQQKIAGDLLSEATHRLEFLVDVGLHYLTLDRGMPTLSGGESQRIRLAGQIGRALTGVLYVLDEPTIGLHPRDNGRLISALHKLRDLGNTLVLVEHDREVLESADRLYDFGPGSGRFGGNVVAEGTPAELKASPNGSLTGQYLSGKMGIPVPRTRRMVQHSPRRVAGGEGSESRPARPPHPQPLSQGERGEGLKEQYNSPPGGAWLSITNCRRNNLRGVDLHIPLGALTCVTGLSGSGKSSLILETLARAVARHLHRQGEAPGPFDELIGVEQISRIIEVDQQPLGATPASNPATYTGVFDPIRELFSRLPDSKVRGYKPGRFSFNRAGGRCEDCEGLGQKKIEMHFLPDVWVECDTCRGHRYNAETLTVRYKGHSISDVLNLSIGQALEHFENIPKIRAPLATLAAIGLDYLTLGQSATTLSGGEAQRVKLAAELARPNTGRTLYLLDEPTTGLHIDDISKLLKVLGSLVEQGNTVVIIEHNLDVIKTADWIVDLGPEAGVDGGYIVVQGTPEEVVEYAAKARTAQSPHSRPLSRRERGEVGSTLPAPGSMLSHTGELLARILAQQPRGDIEVLDPKKLAKKRSGDIDIAQVGRETAMPWQADGRAWHTGGRVARNGKQSRWEGAALAKVVDFIEQFEGLKPANWNDQSTVEITAERKVGTGWFFHALTGDEWLVRLYFRVPKNTFDAEKITRSLRLKAVDEIDEIQVYGRGERVKFKNSKGPFQEVAIDVHWLKEIDTPAFWEFVEHAVASYLERVEVQQQRSPEDLMPWKVLGRKWHLTRKGFPSNKRVHWELAVLEQLLDILDASLKKSDIDWSNKTLISYKSATDGGLQVEVQTKRREGVFLTILMPPGKIALGQIATLGADREIASHRSGSDAVKVRFDDVEQVDKGGLTALLQQVEFSL